MGSIRRSGAFWWWLVILAAALTLSAGATRFGYFACDLTLARALQSVESGLLAYLMQGASYLFGSWRFAVLVLLAAMLVWNRCGNRHAWLVLAGGAASYFNSLLKLLVGRVRPSADLLTVATQADGSSFPSGHTFSATMLLGALVILVLLGASGRVLKVAAIVTATSLVALVGVSRVYLGVHWPSDVLGACLWAAVLLIPLYHFGRRWLSTGSYPGMVDKNIR